LSQHQPPWRCGATSINGNGNGAPAAVLRAVKLVNAGAAKGQERMAVLATTTNATTNATPGSPPASTVAAATATAANDDDDNKDDGVDLDMPCHRVRDLRRMLDASAYCLADAKANAAVARVECEWRSELYKWRVGEWISQIEEELRRMRIKAERFSAGWTRLRAAVGRRGRKTRAKGGEASSSAAAAAKNNDVPPPRCVLGGGSGVCFSPSRPPPTLPSIVVVAEDPRQDLHRGGR
jgi:hypothetical protein